METRKHGAHVEVSAELLADALDMQASMTRYLNASDAERAEWARQAKERRAAERAAATPAPLTLVALVAKLNWSEEYAEHFVQPYCTCDDSRDGWDYCQHAYDEGVV